MRFRITLKHGPKQQSARLSHDAQHVQLESLAGHTGGADAATQQRCARRVRGVRAGCAVIPAHTVPFAVELEPEVLTRRRGHLEKGSHRSCIRWRHKFRLCPALVLFETIVHGNI